MISCFADGKDWLQLFNPKEAQCNKISHVLGDNPEILEALLLPTVTPGLELEEKKLHTRKKGRWQSFR